MKISAANSLVTTIYLGLDTDFLLLFVVFLFRDVCFSDEDVDDEGVGNGGVDDKGVGNGGVNDEGVGNEGVGDEGVGLSEVFCCLLDDFDFLVRGGGDDSLLEEEEEDSVVESLLFCFSLCLLFLLLFLPLKEDLLCCIM